MAHLVPNPPPANYQVPQLLRFNVLSADGIGTVLVWGINDWTKPWRVGTDNPIDVVSEPFLGPGPDLTLYKLRGVRQGMKLALFVYDDSKWKRFSEYVEVDSNVADRFAALSVSGRLPRSHFNNHISFYPFGALQANQPMPESEWMDKIEDALGKVSRNVIGAAVLKGIRKDITIYPYLPADKNAFSDVHINPKQWTTEFRPGANVDEILLHELIHVVENNYSMYENRWGFMFDGSDFLTVNATNVYSCMLGRALRKDHHDFLSLPVEHFENPRLHYEQQAPNYMRADASAGDLVDVLRKIEGVWNPFSYFPAFANRGMFGYG